MSLLPYLNIPIGNNSFGKKLLKAMNQVNGSLIRYRVNGYYDHVVCRSFLWRPSKFEDGWHWLTFAWSYHEPCGMDWSTEWMSNDEFILFKLSNDLKKVEH